MTLKRKVVLGASVTLVLAAATTGVRAYRVVGGSDAPAYLAGDLLLVNRAAYGVRLPFLGRGLAGPRRPDRGDVVLLRVPGESLLVFKVVVGLPGEHVEVSAGRVTLDGGPLQYAPLDRRHWDWVPEENQVGARVEREVGSGLDQVVSLDPARTEDVFGPALIPPEHVFVLGSNRSHSRDSRHFGPVPLEDILGEVVLNVSALGRGR